MKNQDSENQSAALQMAVGLKQIPSHIFKGLVDSASDADHQHAIASFKEIFTKQFTMLSTTIVERYNAASLQSKKEADALAVNAAGEEMLKSVPMITGNLKSIFSKLSLNSIVKEIKKLVLFILDKIGAPSWIIDVLLIIDQILNALLGWDLPTELPEILSKMERDYFGELTAHSELQHRRNIQFGLSE